MFIIAHRGASGLAPENTISSLQKAEEYKVDMVEADLRQTKDGHIVLMHDPTLMRTHDDRRGVKHLTLAEIKDIGNREGRDIPALEEFLSQAKTPVNLELKEYGFEEKVLAAIKNFTFEVLVSSSNPAVLKKIRTLDEKVKLGFIIGPRWEKFFPLAMALARHLDLHSVHPYYTVITPKHMQSLRELKAKIYVWTVDSKHEYEILKGFGIDGVFTDHPEIITR